MMKHEKLSNFVRLPWNCIAYDNGKAVSTTHWCPVSSREIKGMVSVFLVHQIGRDLETTFRKYYGQIYILSCSAIIRFIHHSKDDFSVNEMRL